MKTLSLFIFSILLGLSVSNNIHSKGKDLIEVCSNLSASIRIIATQRDSGVDNKNLKVNRDLYKIETFPDVSLEQIIDIVEKISFLKPNVLSNAFASACMSKQSYNSVDSDYYRKFEGCNPYTENEELVFKCVTNIVSF